MSDRPRWQLPVLVLAVLLVVAQVVVFVALRGRSKDTPIDAGPVALVAPHGGSSVQGSGPTPLAQGPLLDASTEVSIPDATVAPVVEPTPEPDPTPPVVAKKRMTRAEIAEQKRKDREEQERVAREAREMREARDRKIEQDRAAEKAKMDAELERQRLATQKAEADAAAAKAAAEKARLEAIAKPTIDPTATAKPAPDVLVLVLGPGTPSLSADQIRSVFLGRTSV